MASEIPASICFLNSSSGRAISIPPLSERTSTGRAEPEKKLRRRILESPPHTSAVILRDAAAVHDFLPGLTGCRSWECGATCAGVELKLTRAWPPPVVPTPKLCCEAMLGTLESPSVELPVDLLPSRPWRW